MQRIPETQRYTSGILTLLCKLDREALDNVYLEFEKLQVPFSLGKTQGAIYTFKTKKSANTF